MIDFSNPEGIQRTYDKARRFLRPPPVLSASEWAERNVKIPIGNAVPGYIRFDNAPYQREPLDLYNDKSVQRITLMWGAQTGKTQLLNCGFGISHRSRTCFADYVAAKSVGFAHLARN